MYASTADKMSTKLSKKILKILHYKCLIFKKFIKIGFQNKNVGKTPYFVGKTVFITLLKALSPEAEKSKIFVRNSGCWDIQLQYYSGKCVINCLIYKVSTKSLVL